MLEFLELNTTEGIVRFIVSGHFFTLTFWLGVWYGRATKAKEPGRAKE